MTTEQDNFYVTQIAQKGAHQNNENEEKPLNQHYQTQLKEQQKEQPGINLKTLLTVFNEKDQRERGIITLAEAQEIIKTYNLPSENIKDYYKISLAAYEGHVSFDEFLFMFNLCETQDQPIEKQYQIGRSVDYRLVDFLKLLNNYRKKVEKQNNYKQAKKSKTKIEQIRQRELMRKRNYLDILHERQLLELQQQQKKKFIQFCNTWDQYMIQYENSAVDLIEKLKIKHEAEMMEFMQKTKEELASKMHYSKKVIELLTLEKNLVKTQDYGKADQVKQQIRVLKEQQLLKKRQQDEESLQARCSTLRKHQQVNLNNLLQKIQKDRNDQIKQRQTDSEKLIIRNKSLITEVNHKHNNALKRIYEQLHNLSLDLINNSKNETIK